MSRRLSSSTPATSGTPGWDGCAGSDRDAVCANASGEDVREKSAAPTMGDLPGEMAAPFANRYQRPVDKATFLA